jgi:hypothetical protein
LVNKTFIWAQKSSLGPPKTGPLLQNCSFGKLTQTDLLVNKTVLLVNKAVLLVSAILSVNKAILLGCQLLHYNVRKLMLPLKQKVMGLGFRCGQRSNV